MPSFPVVSHSWGSEIIFAILYNKIGFFGLTFIFTSLLIIFLFFINWFLVKNFNKEFRKIAFPWILSIFIVSATVFLNFFYVRPQIISWVLWGLFVLVISDKKRFIKYRIFLPILFLLWANLHGEFALGIVVLIFITFFKFLIDRKIDFNNLMICLLSIFVTLINPYGINLWREVFATYFNPYLRLYISEWQPIFLSYFDLSLIFSFVFSTYLVWLYRKHFGLDLFLIYIFLFMQAIVSIKNIPLWLIFSFVFTYKGVYLLYKSLNNNISRHRFKISGKFLLASVLFLFVFQVFLNFKEIIYSVNPFATSYPSEALLFLKANPKERQIFSSFNWGGYLVWQIPSKKVFIDGRMAVWDWSPASHSETGNAFKDYLNILSGELDFNMIANKYNIDTVLWPKSVVPSTSDLKLTQTFCSHVRLYLCKSLNMVMFPKILIKDGWHPIYSDKIAAIYRR